MKWKCDVCGYVYSEKKGSPRDKVKPGTSFEDLEENWVCPACQAGKEEFYLLDSEIDKKDMGLG